MAGAGTPTALRANRSMTEYTLTGENPTDLPKRAVRALTEKMTVLPDTGRAKDADGLFLVVSESGSEYLVDARGGACDCPDACHNLEAEERCKHERRVEYAVGGTPIPAWAETDSIDSQLGTHTKSDPVYAVTDGGIAGESTEQSFELLEERHDDARGFIEDHRGECVNGTEGCDGPDGEALPCFACYDLEEAE